MSRPGRLDGRTCLIVGGTGGIGLASARRFLEEGARVVVAGRSPEIAPAVLGELARAGFGLGIWARARRGRTIGRAAVRSGARRPGRTARRPFSRRRDQRSEVRRRALHECSSEGWDGVMQVNAHGVFLTNRAGRAIRCSSSRSMLPACGGRS